MNSVVKLVFKSDQKWLRYRQKTVQGLIQANEKYWNAP